MSKARMRLLIAAAFLVMFSGVGIIYYTLAIRPVQIRAQATATTQAFTSAQAEANAQATVSAKATATMQAQAAAATTTALQTIYTQSTSGSPTLSDLLTTNSANNWDAYHTVDGGGCRFEGGALHASVFKTKFYVPCIAKSSSFRNFAFQVQLTIINGDTGGLVFRANRANATFYFFRIGHDGYYSLYTSENKSQGKALTDNISPAIKTAPGQSNSLTAIAQGSNIYLYINQQFAASATDSTYPSGQIGVFAGDTTNPTDVAFNNAQVWMLG